MAYVVNEADNTVWAYTLNKSTGTLQKLAVANTGNSPQAVAVDPLSPTQNFLYVTNNGDNTVSIFGTAGDGAPFFLGSVSTGNSPLSIVLDVAGKFAYVANSSDNTVSEYTINGGTLTSAGIIRARNTPIALALCGGAAAVTYTPKFVYVANGLADTVSQYEVNARGGLKALAGTAATGHYPNSVAVDPTGQFAYVTNSNDNTVSSFRITGSGALLQLGAAVPTGSTPLEIAVDPSGQYAFIVDYGDGAIYEYKIQAGSLTPNGSIPSPGSSAPNAEYACPIPFGGLSAVTVDPTGQYAYVTSPATMSGPGGPTVGNFSPAVICAYSINPQLGTLSLIGSSPPAGFPSTPPVQLLSSAVQEAYPFSIAIDPTGQFAYVADLTYGVVWQLTIDASSGALTLDIPPYPTTPPTMLALPSISANPAPSFSSEYVYAANGVPALSVLSCQIAYAPTQNAGSAGELLPPCTLQPSVPSSVSSPKTLVVDPSGRFVYVDDLAGVKIWQYSVGAGGSLTLMTPNSVPTSSWDFWPWIPPWNGRCRRRSIVRERCPRTVPFLTAIMSRRMPRRSFSYCMNKTIHTIAMLLSGTDCIDVEDPATISLKEHSDEEGLA